MLLQNKTSPNTRLTLRRRPAPPPGFGFLLGQSLRTFGSCSFPRKTSPTVCQPWSCFTSPYSGCQTVVNLKRYMLRRQCRLGLRFFARSVAALAPTQKTAPHWVRPRWAYPTSYTLNVRRHNRKYSIKIMNMIDNI